MLANTNPSLLNVSRITLTPKQGEENLTPVGKEVRHFQNVPTFRIGMFVYWRLSFHRCKTRKKRFV